MSHVHSYTKIFFPKWREGRFVSGHRRRGHVVSHMADGLTHQHWWHCRTCGSDWWC